MAKRSLVILTDDLDGSPDARTVRFSLDAKSYEIDLSEENAGQLHRLLRPYMDAGRRTGGKSRNGGPGRNTSTSSSSRPGILDWAKSQGLVSETHRGRLAQSVYEAYDAAH